MRVPDHSKTALLALLLFALPLLAPAALAQGPDPAPDRAPAPAAELELPVPEAAPDGEAVPDLTPEPTPQCLQITVWAQDPETGECHEFPNTCSVPEGWNRYFDPATCTNW